MMSNLNFVHPLEAAQVRSVLSYVILLSDYLLNENVLNATDLNKPIPAVNAMYKYLVEPSSAQPDDIDNTKLKKLATYLIRNSDLYGSEEGEILDPHFIHSLFNHIINSLVFNNYGNVYGFIAEVVRTSNCTTEKEIHESLFSKLLNEKFKNEYGPDSKLDESSCRKICQEYIFPLFPVSMKNTNILSTDYIYAQAGSIFFRSISKTSDDLVPQDDPMFQIHYENGKFDQYIRVAYIIEQLVTMKKVDNSALRIFALPALLHYVHEKKEDLRNRTIASIINNPNDWKAAFEHLFLNVSDFFQMVDEARDKSYGYTFLHALQTYENQSSLARGNLKSNCPTLNTNDTEQRVREYLECTKDCSCINNGKRINLTPIDVLFREQFNSTVDKYAAYERESLKSTFPEVIKTLMNNQKVEVRKGLFENYFVADSGPSVDNAEEIQVVPEQHDILEFYFPDTKQTFYYGLIRKDFEVSLINETYDKQFREKLGLSSQPFVHWKFQVPLKRLHENFDDFVTNMTKERVKIFERNLRNYKNEKDEQPWWKELLLSLIPFYTCAQATKGDDVHLVKMACSMDVLFLIPGALEVSMSLKELTTVTSRALAKISLSSIKAATSRLSLRAAIRSGGRILIEEGMKFTESFTPQLFKKVGIAVLRMVDPGFELLYSLGKDGLESIGKLVNVMEKRYPGSLLLMQETLKNAMNDMTSVTEEITKKFDFGIFMNGKVYYNSLEKNSGYGYKFLHTSEGKILPLRTVEEFRNKVPVFSSGSEIYEQTRTYVYHRETKIADEIYEIDGIDKIDDTVFYEIKPVLVHLVHGSELKLTERDFKIRFKHVHDKLPCSKGRFRRSPSKQKLCFRTSLSEERNAREEQAVEIATKNSALTTVEVLDELRKYLFLEGSVKTERDFVHDWKKSNFLKVPEWSEEYKIELPEVYNHLRYSFKLNELELPPRLKDNLDYDSYLASKVNEYVSFEDFENIGQYTGSFYREVADDTERGRAMRKSLYRLAIRQSDDPIEEYDRILYRGETRPNHAIDELFYPIGKEFEFTKFTSTSTSRYTASLFREAVMNKVTEVEYLLEFKGTYLRANIEKSIPYTYEKETVLLPGTKFEIKDVVKGVNIRGINTVSVKMSYKPLSKLEDIKRVMRELKELKDFTIKRKISDVY